jgi:hypothetical protein
MLIARSPTRSRSVLILTAETIARLEAAAVDLDVQLVDRAVAGEDALDQLRVALDQRLERRSNAVLREPAHFEQAGLELFELLLKVRH